MEVRELLVEHGDISEHPPQERILIAALECIRASGLEGATVRAIAARAGVNPAAINYYYRSKDRVIEEALRSAWLHVADDIDRIVRETPNADAATRLAVRYLLEGSIGSPKVIRAIITQQPALHAEVAAFFKKLFGRLSGRLTPLLLVAVSVFISVAPDAARGLCGTDLSDQAERERLWKDLAAALLGHAGKTRPHQKASPRLK